MVDTNIGRIGSAFEAARVASVKLDFGPTPNIRVALTDVDISDRAASSLAFSQLGEGFMWGIDEWGSPDKKVIS